MKRHIKFLKITTQAILLFCLIFCFSACVKSRYGGTDFSTLQPVVLIPEGGIAGFSSQALLFPGSDDTDTAFFYINYAATNVAPADQTVTLSIDRAAVATYNATSTLQYSVLPDSLFSFTTTSVTVKKGNNYSDPVPLAVFPSKINPKLNLMIPITIVTAPTGAQISSNFKTIYYHFIGNPLAGNYKQQWIRYNSTTQTGTPAYDVTSIGTLAPVDGTTLSAASGTGVHYIITFSDNGGGVYSDFNVSFDPKEIAGSGITISGGPTVVSADPIAGKYEFNFTYLNGSGKPRNITDKFTK